MKEWRKIVVYDSSFFESQKAGSKMSAEVILPYVKDTCDPSSVVDVGCGIGTWLAVWITLDVDKVLGLDGEWVDLDQLLISRQSFRVFDITGDEHSFQRYDLAQCLEVGEHIDARFSDCLVSLLCTLSDSVLFSAAIPGQGGTHHINEQWPDYWQIKFDSRNYECFDIIRPKFWNNQNIEFWYRQNMFMFINRSNEHLMERVQAKTEIGASMPNRCVHPEQFSRCSQMTKPSLKTLLKQLPGATRRALTRRIKKAWEYLT